MSSKKQSRVLGEDDGNDAPIVMEGISSRSSNSPSLALASLEPKCSVVRPMVIQNQPVRMEAFQPIKEKLRNKKIDSCMSDVEMPEVEKLEPEEVVPTPVFVRKDDVDGTGGGAVVGSAVENI